MPVEPVITLPRESPLLLTRFQAQVARDQKAVGFLPMEPVEFVRLTTASEAGAWAILGAAPDYKGPKFDVDQYNRWSLARDIGMAPTLRIDRKTGRVRSHEGRHRAGAVYRHDPNAILWVAIVLTDPEGYAHYYDLVGKQWDKRYLGWEDVPETLYGQFRPEVRVRIAPSRLRPVWTPKGDPKLPNPRRKGESRRPPLRLARLFARVHQFVTGKIPALRRVRLVLCPEIRKGKRGAAARRAFMHVGHYDDVICVHPLANRLSTGYLAGLFLHEFGHLATDAGDAEADRWVFERLGIPILYRGAMRLEWVAPEVLAKRGL
jgi:hypothetical protein